MVKEPKALIGEVVSERTPVIEESLYQPWQQRVAEERDALAGKIRELKEFIFNSPVYPTLSAEESNRIRLGLAYMMAMQQLVDQIILEFQ